MRSLLECHAIGLMFQVGTTWLQWMRCVQDCPPFCRAPCAYADHTGATTTTHTSSYARTHLKLLMQLLLQLHLEQQRLLQVAAVDR